MKRLYIHVGLPKTATKFLQYTMKDNIGLLRQYDIHYDPELFLLFTELRNSMPLSDLQRQEAQRVFAHLAKVKQGSIVGSSEALSGNVYFPEKLPAFLDEVKELLKGFDVHPIFTTRNQDTWLESMYQQHIKEGGHWAFKEWLKRFPVKSLDWNWRKSLYLDRWDKFSTLSYEISHRDTLEYVHSFRHLFHEQFIPLAINYQLYNPGLSKLGVEILNRCSDLFTDEQLTPFREYIQEHYHKQPWDRIGYFSDSERKQLLADLAVDPYQVKERHYRRQCNMCGLYLKVGESFENDCGTCEECMQQAKDKLLTHQAMKNIRIHQEAIRLRRMRVCGHTEAPMRSEGYSDV